MHLSEEEFMRRREVIAGALASVGLGVSVPVIDAAARLDWSELDTDPDSVVARHGTYFDTMPAREHLPYLLRDFAHLDTRSRVYLAAMVGESLSVLGNTRDAQRWLSWAGQRQQSRGQAAWLHGRNGYLALDMNRPDLVRSGQDATGHANYAKAQARLGNREEAVIALERAGKSATGPGQLLFSFPVGEWHETGSIVHTRLGNTRAAAEHQQEALDKLPARDVLSRTLLNLDMAERLSREGQADAAKTHLYSTLASLPNGHRYDIVNRRASEVSNTLAA